MEGNHYLLIDGDELDLLREGLRMSRLYQQGITDREGRMKLKEVQRLEARLLRIKVRKWRRRKVDNDAPPATGE